MLRDQFIEGMSFVAATVNVVTTDGPAGRAGLTVSAMCSVSADPPSLLVCVNHSSASCDRTEKNKAFCVNVLRDSQTHVSDAFSGRYKNMYDDRFACAEWNTVTTGSPALEDSLVVFDCRMTTSFRSGTHVIYIGELEGIRKETGTNPLRTAGRVCVKRTRSLLPSCFGRKACPTVLSAPRLAPGRRSEIQSLWATVKPLRRGRGDSRILIALNVVHPDTTKCKERSVSALALTFMTRPGVWCARSLGRFMPRSRISSVENSVIENDTSWIFCSRFCAVTTICSMRFLCDCCGRRSSDYR